MMSLLLAQCLAMTFFLPAFNLQLSVMEPVSFLPIKDLFIDSFSRLEDFDRLYKHINSNNLALRFHVYKPVYRHLDPNKPLPDSTEDAVVFVYPVVDTGIVDGDILITSLPSLPKNMNESSEALLSKHSFTVQCDGWSRTFNGFGTLRLSSSCGSKWFKIDHYVLRLGQDQLRLKSSVTIEQILRLMDDSIETITIETVSKARFIIWVVANSLLGSLLIIQFIILLWYTRRTNARAIKSQIGSGINSPTTVTATTLASQIIKSVPLIGGDRMRSASFSYMPLDAEEAGLLCAEHEILC